MRATGTFHFEIPEKILTEFANSNLDYNDSWQYEHSWEDIIEDYLAHAVEDHAGEFSCTVEQSRS